MRCQPEGVVAALAIELKVVKAAKPVSVLGDGIGPYPGGCCEHDRVVSTV